MIWTFWAKGRGACLVRYVFGLILTFALLAGCGSRYPLDIPEAQWEAMTPQEQLEARQEQAKLDRAAEERRTTEARAREAQAKKWLKDLEASREDARYGERLQCVLSPAQAYIGRSWREIEPLALDVVKGMVLKLDLKEADDGVFRYSTEAYAGFDGQTLSICPEEDYVQKNDPKCARVLATFEQYRKGVETTIKASDFLRGKIVCDLVPGEGMPKRLILEK